MEKRLLWATLGLSLAVLSGCQEVKDFFTTPNITVPPSLTSLSITVDGVEFQGQIHESTKTVTIYVPEGTDLSAPLVTNFDYVGQEANPAPGFSHVYQAPAVVTLIKDEITVAYEVRVVPTSAVVPTAEALVGTWTMDFVQRYTETSSDGEVVTSRDVEETGTFSIRFATDGTYLQWTQRTSTYSNGDVAETEFTQGKGNFIIDERGNLVLHETEQRYSELPFVDETGWEPTDYTKGIPIVLINGELYSRLGYSSVLLQAKGPTQGVVGTWEFSNFSQSDMDPIDYYRVELVFNSDGSMAQYQYSGTTLDNMTLEGSGSGTYLVDEALGTITLTNDGASEATSMKFALFGPYFVLTAPEMPTLGGLTKLEE